ncbi:glycosyltransferase family 10 domain-containing protein [Lacipirellula sp.]|uniref:glycosyltransferase family 10 domain-containing protein n=1 Tax=Lacipirellula sp. TaxID=2691419 RepID=UPI003D12456C
MKPRIRLDYADFWGIFRPQNNYFTHLLSPHYEIEIAEQPDFLIYSGFGNTFRRRTGTRIFYTGENCRPNFRECDFAFTFDFVDRAEHYRLPLYAWYGDPGMLVKGEVDAERILAQKTSFCNFIYSNPKCKTRNKFFELLSKYKRVDSGGKLMNNIGGRVANKREFMSRYKFTIAFENDSYPGYTTEKIVHLMMAESLPIYWGNPLVHLDFNPQSFVNYFDYGSLEALVDRVIEIDRDDALYCEYVRQPWYHGNEVNEFVRRENVLDAFERILSASGPVRNRHIFRILDWRAALPSAKRRKAA